MIPVSPVREQLTHDFAFTLLIRKTKQKIVKSERSVYEFAYFPVHASRHSLAGMVAWTGLRWNIEDDNKTAKNESVLED